MLRIAPEDLAKLAPVTPCACQGDPAAITLFDGLLRGEQIDPRRSGVALPCGCQLQPLDSGLKHWGSQTVLALHCRWHLGEPLWQGVRDVREGQAGEYRRTRGRSATPAVIRVVQEP